MNLLETLSPFILALHILICIFLIVVILLQAGKGADMGAAFGAGSSQTLFGARGAATFLSKITTVTAILFLVTSISLALIHRNRSNGIVPSVIPQPEAAAPAPAEPPAAPAAPAPATPEQTPTPAAP